MRSSQARDVEHDQSRADKAPTDCRNLPIAVKGDTVRRGNKGQTMWMFAREREKAEETQDEERQRMTGRKEG